MKYIKGNVERIVSNIVDAKKLEADGFVAVNPKKKPEPAAVVVEPEPEADEKKVVATPKQHTRRRKKED